MAPRKPATIPIDRAEPRPTCYRCFRPESHCICGLINSFQAHCNVLVVQHPNERKKYYNTAKLLLRALENASLLRGIEFSDDVWEGKLTGQNAYLLFPGSDVLDLSEVALSGKDTVIVVDGTWSEAGKIVSRNSWLQSLPRVSFKDRIRSNYRIRKQPKESYLSTLESVAYLLKLNAPVSGHERAIPMYDGILSAFDRMVEQQMSHWPRMKLA